MKSIPHTPWSVHDAENIYGIKNWGNSYFTISDNGNATIAPVDVIAGLRERGIEMPAQLRIENLLDHRISCLNDAFAKEIKAMITTIIIVAYSQLKRINNTMWLRKSHILVAVTIMG